MADAAVEKLRSARKVASVALMEAISLEARFPAALKLLVEGRDIAYYIGRITSIGPDVVVHSLDCGGKNNVLYVYEQFSARPEYAEAFFCFIVDRDYDYDLLATNNPRLWVTPCHSLENLYLSEATFRRIISAEFDLTPVGTTEVDYERIERLFQSQLVKFELAMKHATAWAVAQVRYANKHSLSAPMFNNVPLDRLVHVGKKTVEKIHKDSQLWPLHQNSHPITHGEFKDAERLLSNKVIRSEVRGKYALEFLRSWLVLLKHDRTSRVPSLFSQKGKVRLALSRDGLISELSQYADTPESLIGFITHQVDLVKGKMS